MSWFVVDDQFFQHAKAQALMRRALQDSDPDAGLAGLAWTMIGSRLKAGDGDGVLSMFDLIQVVPDPARAIRVAQILVEVGLWHDHEHYCERCGQPPASSWSFHDWRVYYPRDSRAERLAKALREERRDKRLQDEVWERDRLADVFAQSGQEWALCAYCEEKVWRKNRTGDLAPEIDHVYALAIGSVGLVISCRSCNRKKGNRSASDAGMTLHPTPAHAAALAARSDTFSRSCGPAEMVRRDGDAPVPNSDGETCSRPCGPAGQEGHGSRSYGLADLSAAVAPARTAGTAPQPPVEPPVWVNPAPRCPGSSVPISGSDDAVDTDIDRQQTPENTQKAASGVSEATVGTCATVAAFGPHSAADEPTHAHAPTHARGRAPARAHGRVRPCAIPPGRAGQGGAGSGRERQGQARRGRGRRRRRGRGSPAPPSPTRTDQVTGQQQEKEDL